MQSTTTITYRGCRMTVTTDFTGDYSPSMPLVWQNLDDYYIDELTVCPDQRVNDLVHELIGQNAFEKEELIKLVIEQAQSEPLAASGR
jgi:hypothetical protein